MAEQKESFSSYVENDSELAGRLAEVDPRFHQALGMRVALRVLPLVCPGLITGNPDLGVVAFRLGFSSWAMNKYADVIAPETASIPAGGYDIARNIDDPGEMAAHAAALAALMGPESPNRVNMLNVLGASMAAARTIGDDDAVEQIRQSVLQDIGALNQIDGQLVDEPLWLGDVRGDPTFEANFPLWARKAFDAIAGQLDGAQGHWRSFVDWYRALLPNTRTAKPESAFGEEADLQLVAMPDDFWRRKTDDVLVDVDRLRRGEAIRFNSPPPDGPEKFTRPDGRRETRTVFLSDVHDPDVDYLDRAKQAFVLAGRLNLIWNKENATNESGEHARDSIRPGFVVQIDAPWGGGKTAFASFLATILNPYRHDVPLPMWLDALPMKDERFWPKENRRPWHVVGFNAWRHQQVKPPWWVFYDVVRRHCAEAALSELNRQAAELPSPADRFYGRSWLSRRLRGFKEWGSELVWRLWTPDFRAKFILSVVTTVFVAGLFAFKIIRFGEKGIALSPELGAHADSFQALWLTPLVLLFTGAPAVWTILSGATQTLFRGTPEAAQNYALGAGDPLDRFRRHFARVIQRFSRPVLIIIDDLDRCEPEYVVELIRGIQTILTSSRIVFLLLGDKDWIEQAFAETNKTMKGIDVGGEHEFGSRFVEKAIQFSFVLPKISGPSRQAYVRGLLRLDDQKQDARDDGDKMASPSRQAAVARLNEREEEVLGVEDYAKREQAASKMRAESTLPDLDKREKDEVLRRFEERLALRAAADVSAERATSHMLEALAPLLPANPRQIKRIVNSISLIQEIARLERLAQPGTTEWQALARWIVLLTEWPRTCSTLSAFPTLADQALGISSAETEFPDKAEEILKLIKSNGAVMRLLTFHDVNLGWEKRDIGATEIAWLRRLAPPASRRLLLPIGP
ncbi:P-loop NTPase fold protein [Rhodoblastus sp.]|jgi:hypothetical protein|uniref:KAP family P-loop NTPase fold protein n=1 Tax=Rhodoblastus sp. TaxID=1962975 RepID=UPI0025FE9E45|nr:P-loop NTPase fold protein [Rhodoblastus sp.]